MALRPALAVFIIVAALAWLLERITETANPVSALFNGILANGIWMVLAASIFALVLHFTKQRTQFQTS